PAVQKEPWTKSDCKVIIRERERVGHLLNYGFTWHEAGDRVLAECELKFTTREKVWIDELLELEVHYDDTFDIVLEERNPGSISWLNQANSR
ncbi:unnamed protein product, partial [marine sediment metagenome]